MSVAHLRRLSVVVLAAIAVTALALALAVIRPAQAEPSVATQVETCSGTTSANAVITCTLSPALPSAPEHVDVVVLAPSGGLRNTPIHTAVVGSSASSVTIRVIGSQLTDYGTHVGLTAYKNSSISLSLEAIDTTP